MHSRYLKHWFLTLLAFIFLAINAVAKEPKRIKVAGGQTIITEYYDDGAVKTITHLNPDGSLLGTLYHTSKGIPTYADYYDEQKRVRRRLFYRPDGIPKSANVFDEHGKIVLLQEHDKNGYVIRETVPK
jgi:hypothetical protein